jgi:cytochrome c oxidase subunit 2
VKQDAVPGMRVPISFLPTVQGEFEIVCSQLCGLAHHRMRGTIKVESDEEYAKFLADQAKSQAR